MQLQPRLTTSTTVFHSSRIFLIRLQSVCGNECDTVHVCLNDLLKVQVANVMIYSNMYLSGLYVCVFGGVSHCEFPPFLIVRL